MKKLFGLLVSVVFVVLITIGCSPKPQETTQKEEVKQEAPTKVAQVDTKPTPPAAPEATDPNTWDGWFMSHAEWVGDIKEFETELEEGGLKSGGVALKANAVVADDRVRDLYLAHVFTGLEAGKTYKISLEYRFDTEIPAGDEDLSDDPYVSLQNNKNYNYIQFAVKDGDQRSQEAIMEIEDYPEHARPETKYVPDETIGDEEFHTLELTHKVGENQSFATFMMIVRFRATDSEMNWLWFGNFKVEEAS